MSPPPPFPNEFLPCATWRTLAIRSLLSNTRSPELILSHTQRSILWESISLWCIAWWCGEGGGFNEGGSAILNWHVTTWGRPRGFQRPPAVNMVEKVSRIGNGDFGWNSNHVILHQIRPLRPQPCHCIHEWTYPVKPLYTYPGSATKSLIEPPHPLSEPTKLSHLSFEPLYQSQFWLILHLLDLDPQSECGSGFGSRKLIGCGSNADPKHWLRKTFLFWYGRLGQDSDPDPGLYKWPYINFFGVSKRHKNLRNICCLTFWFMIILFRAHILQNIFRKKLGRKYI
jgi:hypothetical protein